MTTKTADNLTTFEAAMTARWLAKTLAHARIENESVPTADAVDRIRTRVLGGETKQKAVRSIAA